ncbi:MAG TPA: ABC transporter substrate-binding protein [Terrimesophilobacter sp.]|nr:ABC transporter substrate-binding protein [Terrimesophilobacter sp.]
MKFSRRTTAGAAILAASALALVATGCSTPGGDGSDDNEKITLTLATFNDFGYTDDLLQEYEDLHPNITIVHNKAATSNDARENMFTKLGAGSGLSDIEAIEVDWLAELMQYSSKFVPVTDPDAKDRWVDWKAAAATDKDGNLIGYGTDIGPEAVCYRSDLFAAAGLPSDRDAVAELLKGDWQHYYDVGAQYLAGGGTGSWFDSAGATYQGVINQIQNAYEKNDGTVIAADNPEVKAAFESVLKASSTLSAHLGQWGDDWTAGLANGAYATMLCPGWMLGVISGNAPDVTGWDVANVFPGGGGNWGGSYLTVPKQSAHPEAASALASWLTAPEQQLKAFANAGTFPSQVSAYGSDALDGATNEYFNNAPVGSILTDRSNAITVSPFKGVKYFPINDALQKALTRVEDGTQSIADSWNQFVEDVKALS